MLVGLHALLVLPAAALWIVAAGPALRDSPDANIGAGLLGLYLLAFGLPWSATAWLFDLFGAAEPVRDTFIVGLPVLNLGIHAGMAWRREWRRGRAILPASNP